MDNEVVKESLDQMITEDSIKEAYAILQKYKEGKANLESRIVNEEEWYRIRHWEQFEGKANSEEVKPTSAWLFNVLANKHADAMDNYPSPNVLPREADDKQEAKSLTSIIPVVLDQNDFEEVYSDVQSSKNKSGTGIYGVFWDGSKLNGIGDIAVKEVDILNLYWEPGISDIQESQNVFHTAIADNDTLISKYPELKDKLGSGGTTFTVTKYVEDDVVPDTDKSVVIDWYYKRDGKLHFAKFCNDVLLFASENERDEAGSPKYPDGWYAHGKYPFIFDTLFKVKDSCAGFGWISVGRGCQEYIDRGDQAIQSNMLANVKPRFFVRDGSEINETEYADMSKPFVHVQGTNLGEDSVRPIEGKPLAGIYVTCHNNKIDELKEVTSTRDISTGGSTSGVTAASAIAALQESGSKTSRDTNKGSYRAYRQLVLMIIELIRQFYDVARQFRIIGQDGDMQFISYDNSGIAPQSQGGMEFGIKTGDKMPLFDIEVSAQKSSPYSKMSQNELALSFYNLGFFNPQLADQSLACLEMMDFDRKQFITQRIQQNGTMYQMLMQAQQQAFMFASMLDQATGSNFSAQLAAQGSAAPMPTPASGDVNLEDTGAPTEHANVKNAKKRVAESTSPT